MSRGPATDLGAEFTLRVAAIAQSPIPGADHPKRWFLLPEIRSAGWDEAKEILTRAPKPLLVTPLSDPGDLLAQPSAQLGPAMEKDLANQIAFYEEKIPRLGYVDEDLLILGTAQGEFAFSIRDFKQWLRDYQMLARVVLSRTTDPRVAQILVLGPERGKPPLNPYRELPPPAPGDCGHDHSHQ